MRWRPWAAPSTSSRGSNPGVPLSTDRTEASERPAPRSWSDEEEQALRTWTALARCYTTFARSMGSRISDYGLTTAQFGVLEALHHLGSLSLGDLADKLLVTGGNITYVMDRLEERELVERDRSTEDRRVILARLTPKGRELVAEVFPDHTAYVRELMEGLDAEETGELRRLLKKLGKSVAGRQS